MELWLLRSQMFGSFVPKSGRFVPKGWSCRTCTKVLGPFWITGITLIDHFYIYFIELSDIIRAPSSEFLSSSIPSWQILTAHAQTFRGARDLVFCLTVPHDSLLVWASSRGSGETARMRRLAWTFAVRIGDCIGDKYQIRLTRPIQSQVMVKIFNYTTYQINPTANHVSVIFGKLEVHPIISQWLNTFHRCNSPHFISVG